MDVVIIFNGLGNQMSQYAFYLQKKKISSSTKFIFSKKSVKIHNGYELDKVFGIKYYHTFLNKILFWIFKAASYKKFPSFSKPFKKILKFSGIEVINENDDYSFKPQYLNPARGIKFYVGGWHSEKYFSAIETNIRDTFQFDIDKIDNKNLAALEKLKSTISVSIHVRRGDFLNSNNYKKLGAVCTLDYFLSAIEKIKTLTTNPQFYFFTDDVEWVRSYFTEPYFTIIDMNKNGDSWKDMFLISNCDHHINSNSSFSWWSSWIYTNKNKITIVPKNFMTGRYFEDIYPVNWLKLDTENIK